jgi:pimeloyl-ACP methyl ester carboxylesterase
VLEENLPGAVAQAIEDADTFFGVELPALAEWSFGHDQAADIRCPVLSVLGTETQPLWVDVARFLRSSLPHVEDCTIEGAGHLLHIERPQAVARGMAAFLAKNSIAGDRRPLPGNAQASPATGGADKFAGARFS